MRNESRKSIFRSLPERIKIPLRSVRDFLRAIPYYGTGRWCPVCGKSSRKFGRFGQVPRNDAMCVWCGALERHRMVWRYFSQITDLFDGATKRVLHVAPERCLEYKLRQSLCAGYYTADLSSPHVMLKMDITNIPCADQQFDAIYCSHVLEHVKDDKKAISEFYRVLKGGGGWAILLVPITAKTTFENPDIGDPSERLRVFGHEDHVRRYGPDFVERCRDAGFNVRTRHVSDFIEKDDIVRMGLAHVSESIFYCTK
jgi:hypothetical protein